MKYIVIGIIAILVLGGAYYLMNQTPATPDTTQTPNDLNGNGMPDTTDTGTTNTSSDTPGGVQVGVDVSVGKTVEFTVSGKNFSFSPAALSVKKGDRVKITFQNTQGMHDFVIDEFNAKSKIINGGQEDVLEFVADKTGTFEFYCSVGSHRAMGMKGSLVVE